MNRLASQAVEAVGLGENVHLQRSSIVAAIAGLASIMLCLLLFLRYGVVTGTCASAVARDCAVAGGAAATLGVSTRRMARLDRLATRRACLATTSLAAVAMLVMATANVATAGAFDRPWATVLLGIGAILLGVALGLLLVQWGVVFADMYVSDLVTLCAFAMATGTLLFVTIAKYVPVAWDAAISLGLVALSGATLAHLVLNRPADGTADGGGLAVKTFHARRADWVVFLQKITLPLACVGAVERVFTNVAADTMERNVPMLGIASLVIMLFAALMILRFGIYGVRRFGQPFANLIAFLIPLVSLLSMPLAGVDGPASGDVRMYTSLALLLALAWSFMGNASIEYLLHPACLYGLGIGSQLVGFALGGLLVELASANAITGELVLSVVCLVMSIGFLPPRPAPNLSRSGDIASAIAAREAAAGTAGVRGARAAGTVGRRGIDGRVGVGSAACAHCPRVATQVGSAGSDTGTGGGVARSGEGVAGVASAGAGMVTGIGEKADGHRDDGTRGGGRFIRRCQVISRLYQLSQRESEVLVLLGKGRSMAYIKDKLVISEGTTKTHINHIYKKLGVHSHNELIDLIETFPLEEWER